MNKKRKLAGLLFWIVLLCTRGAVAGHVEDLVAETELRWTGHKVSSSTNPLPTLFTFGMNIDEADFIEPLEDDEWRAALNGAKSRALVAGNEEGQRVIRVMSEIDRSTSNKVAWKPLLLLEFSLILAEQGRFVDAERCCLRALRLAESNCQNDVSGLIEVYYRGAEILVDIGELNLGGRLCDFCNKLAPSLKDSELFNLVKFKFLALLTVINLKREQIDLANSSFSAIAPYRGDGWESAISDVVWGEIQASMGRWDLSEKFFSNALRILLASRGSNPSAERLMRDAYLGLMESLNALQRAGEALQVSSKLSWAESNSIGPLRKTRLQLTLSASYLLLGNRSAAVSAYRKHLDAVACAIQGAMAGSEDQRLNWKKSNLDMTLPVHLLPAAEVAALTMQWKGLVVDSLIGDSQSFRGADERVAAILSGEAWDTRRKILQKQVARDELDLARLKNRLIALEREMARKTAKSANSRVSNADFDSLMQSLAPTDCLVDFVTFRQPADMFRGVEKFGAVVVIRGKGVRWVELGETAWVTKLIHKFEASLFSSLAGSGVEQASRALHQIVWKEVANLLPKDVKRAFVSPDGSLNFISFSCLTSQSGRLVVEDLEVSLIASSRDLLRVTERTESRDVHIFANPTFARQGDDAPLPAGEPVFPWSLAPLPGTQEEARSVASAASVNKFSVTSHLGKMATKAALFQVSSPRIVHFATHGFLLGHRPFSTGDVNTRGMQAKGVSETPTEKSQLESMFSSGLALSGCQDTFRIWNRGSATGVGDDGVLTAMDIANLTMRGTSLVVLSACETGKGDFKSGEGVFGMRRAFQIAGVQNLVVAMWPVSDEAAPRFMRIFYSKFLSGVAVSTALRDAQVQLISASRKSDGLEVAIRDYCPFAAITLSKFTEKGRQKELHKNEPLRVPQTYKQSDVDLLDTFSK